jgi:hypothetical protein
VRQPFPLLLSARRRFAESEFIGLMHACVVISLRYNIICGYSPAEQERTNNAVAEHIARGEIPGLASALAAMTGVYPNDTAFRAAFADKSIPDAGLIQPGPGQCPVPGQARGLRAQRLRDHPAPGAGVRRMDAPAHRRPSGVDGQPGHLDLAHRPTGLEKRWQTSRNWS